MRADVHRLRVDSTARGHERRGPRYGVVVQATRYLHLTPDELQRVDIALRGLLDLL